MARVERDSGPSGAAAGSNRVPSNPRAGSRLKSARAQGAKDLQLAANILVVG